MKTFEVNTQEVTLIDEVRSIVSIRFNPYVAEEMDKAWEENNSYVSKGYTHVTTADHEDGYCQIMLLQKTIGGTN